MINIDTWVAGYKVQISDWIDGKSIYLNICYYRPGSSLSQPPAVNRSFLLPLDMEQTLRNYLHSVVVGLMEAPSSPDDPIVEITLRADNGTTAQKPAEETSVPTAG